MGSDWDGVLKEFIPRIALARDSDAYRREMIALIAKVNDTHANLWNGLAARPPAGACDLPVKIRFVENQAMVTGYAEPGAGAASGLKPGDIISELDGAPVSQLVKAWTPYYADSNDAARLRDISKAMTNGDCEKPAALRILRGTEKIDLTARRGKPVPRKSPEAHDLSGEAFQLLSDDIGYIKISAAASLDVGKAIEAASKTKGLIIDIRNYPSAMTISNLGGAMVTKETPFARFTKMDLSNPGAFYWTSPEIIDPQQPQYHGKVVVLVDEVTQSSAEYHAMAFRAAGGIVIGSTTAGADGNVSQISLPGALSTMISGIGVFYPDKRPTQRIGIVPDKEVKPAIAEMRAGRDEVLEAVMREIVGPEAQIPDTRRLVQP